MRQRIHANRTGWLVATGVVWALAILALSIVLGRDRAELQGPATGFEGTWPSYESFVELVDESDVVVVGFVDGVHEGEIDFEGTEEETRHINTIVSVTWVLSGSVPGGEVTVKTLEGAYGGFDHVEWRIDGTQVALFLTPSTEEPGLYIPANTNYSQTAYVIEDDELDAVLGEGDPLTEEIGAMSLSQFLAQF